jgi:hypothetical protein
MIDKEKILDNIFFELNEETWFDCLHFHSDWESEGNSDWVKREIYLNDLFSFYLIIKERLLNLPKDFQLFIIIDENDSGQDAVYVHTKNPNSDNFPIKVSPSSNTELFDLQLKDFIDGLEMELLIEDINEGRQFYLFDPKIGIPLN